MQQNELYYIPNPQAHDMGTMFGIAEDRRKEISKGLDEMMRIGTTDKTRLIYASDIIRYIEILCNTKEEFLWAFTNHVLYMVRTHRIALTPEQLEQQIKQYGQPQNLK